LKKLLSISLLLLITVISVEIQYVSALENGETVTSEELDKLIKNGTLFLNSADFIDDTVIDFDNEGNIIDDYDIYINSLNDEERDNLLLEQGIDPQTGNPIDPQTGELIEFINYPDGLYRSSETLYETNNGETMVYWGEYNGNILGNWIATDEINDYGLTVYKSYILSDSINELKIESGHTSFVVDKNTCELKLYDGGRLTDNSKAIILSDEFISRQSIGMSDTWIDSTTNNADCFVSYVENDDNVLNITTTREDDNGLLVVKYIFNNVSLKQQSEYTNYSEPNSKFGFIQKLKIPRDITINGNDYDLIDFNGLYLPRDWIQANNATVLQVMKDMDYDMDIGFDQLWGIGISVDDESDNHATVLFDYVYQSDPLLIGETIILDPSYVWGSPISGSMQTTSNNPNSWNGCGSNNASDIAETINGVFSTPSIGSSNHYGVINGVTYPNWFDGDLRYNGVRVYHGFNGGSQHSTCKVTYNMASGGEYVHQIKTVYTSDRQDSSAQCNITGYYSTNSGSSYTQFMTANSCYNYLSAWTGGAFQIRSDTTSIAQTITNVQYVVNSYASTTRLLEVQTERIQLTEPSEPQSLVIDTQDVANEITLNWSAPSDNGGSSITNYQVFLNNTLISTTGNVLTFDDTISGSEIGAYLEYKLKAVNAQGTSTNFSNTANITSWNVPDQVTGLSVTSGTNPSMTWNAPSSDDTLTNYKIYRDGSLHDTISASGTSYTDSTSLSSGTTYAYQIAGVSAVGTGTLSSSVNGIAGTPADPPSNVQAVISDPNNSPLDVTVTYTTPSNVGTGTLTGFQLLRNGTAVSTVGLTNTISDTAPSGGNVFTYTVKSLSTHGSSSASSGSSVTTPNTPDQVTGLTVTPVSTSRIDLSWNTPSDNNSQISGYKVQISSNGGSSYTDILTGNVNTVYQALSLNTNSQYHFKVSAINAVGTGTASDVKNTYTMTPTPASLTATPVSEVQINLAWGNSTGATGYKIEFESPVDNGFTTLVNNTGTTDLTYSVTGLTTATQYNFKVSGWNNGGTSQSSPEASAYTWGILQAPVIDSVSRLSPTSLKVDWTTGAGLPVATGYKIERQLGSGWTILANNTGTTDVTYTDSSLPEADQVASYRIYAINIIGTSPASNEVSSDVIASGGGSSGGGGGSSGTAVSSQTGISSLTDLTYIDQIHRVVLGQLLSKSINVAWDSSNNLEVKSIVVSDSPFRIVFQEVPFVLLGDPSGISNGKINYSVQIPNEFCTQQGQINCVEQRQYDIPVEIQTVHKGSTLTKTSVIKIDLTSSSDIPLIFVLLAIGAVPVAFILRKVGKGSSRRKASGSSRKSSKNGSNSKKVSL